MDNSDNEVKIHKYKSDKSVMMTVAQGEQIAVEENMDEESDGWIEVSTENGKGYVKSEDVSVTDAYPVAETSEEQQERIENATVKDIADDAQMKADKASEVAQAAAEKAQAQKDIDEDGYWGVKQTSQRLFDFASALAGDDVENACRFACAAGSWCTQYPGASAQVISQEAVRGLMR